MPEAKQIAVMFSGGTDSTFAAMTQIQRYNRVHLVTFYRKGLMKPENAEEAVARLRTAFPDREIIHHQYDFEDIYQMITPHAEKAQVQQAVLKQEIAPLWKDPHGMKHGREKYKANMRRLFMANECLQCKIAMYIGAIRFCKENTIESLCDGSNTEQIDDGSQVEAVKTMAGFIFKYCGIDFTSPAFYVSAEDRCKALYEMNITDHLEHKKLEKTHQIPSRQIQCTVPASVLWTVCIFPWLVYDGPSCNDYVEMCCQYFSYAMSEGLLMIFNDAPNPVDGPIHKYDNIR